MGNNPDVTLNIPLILHAEWAAVSKTGILSDVWEYSGRRPEP
jgi:hypothetical protein